jgi:hypothetical protein
MTSNTSDKPYTTFWLFVGLKYVSPEENRK